jgi:hypothetical protein
MDRLKADFIASLPMQPGGCDCYYFENVREANFGLLKRNRPGNGSTSGAGEKRATRLCLIKVKL